MTRHLYLKFKALIPEPLRDILSFINQHLFARHAVRKKLGLWFETDFRKKYQAYTAQDWKRLYETCWRHTTDTCTKKGDSRQIIDAIGQPCSVLDIGSGTGELALSLAQAGFRVTALDLSFEALRFSRNQIEKMDVHVPLVESFAEDLPFPSSAFDCITCCHTLEHVSDLNRAVAEIKRVAKKKFVILVPKQKYRLYAENYHTHFFSTTEQLADVFKMKKFKCVELGGDRKNSGYPDPMLMYVGTFT
jgi:SAM-dependent methyltransferase